MREVARKYPDDPVRPRRQQPTGGDRRDAVAERLPLRARRRPAGRGSRHLRLPRSRLETRGRRRRRLQLGLGAGGGVHGGVLRARAVASSAGSTCSPTTRRRPMFAASPSRTSTALLRFVTPFAGSSEFLRALARRLGSPSGGCCSVRGSRSIRCSGATSGALSSGAVAGTVAASRRHAGAGRAGARIPRRLPQGAGLSSATWCLKATRPRSRRCSTRSKTATVTPSRLNAALARHGSSLARCRRGSTGTVRQSWTVISLALSPSRAVRRSG